MDRFKKRKGILIMETTTKLELTNDDVCLVLSALGEYKSKMYQQGEYLMSHEASNVMAKIKNGEQNG